MMKNLAEKWLDRISSAKKREYKWRKRGDTINDIYTCEDKSANSYSILYSNTETLKPIVFNRVPSPVIIRTFSDKDNIARDVSTVLERAVKLSNDLGGFDAQVKMARDDYLLAGRGTMRIKLVNDIKTNVERVDLAEIEEVEEDLEVSEIDGNLVVEKEFDELDFQRTEKEYVHWKDFIHSQARTWDEVDWVGFRGLLNRTEFEEQFPDINSADVSFSIKEDGTADKSSIENQGCDNVTEVWEIWDKESGMQYFFSTGYNKGALSKEKDPLGISGFFPCPRPLYSITTTDSLIPTPFYIEYQHQAIELDSITTRISRLVEQLRYRGVYDASQRTIASVFNAKDGDFVPVDRWSELTAKGGFQSAISNLPLAELQSVILSLYQQRSETLQSIYEIIGIGDIMRAKSNPNETAKAQGIKARFGTLRTSEYQRQIQDFIRDLYRIEGEVISNNVEGEFLEKMTGIKVSEEMVELMKADNPRRFRIDIETDSTIAPDEEAEKQEAIELVSALTQYATQASPAITAQVGDEFNKKLFFSIFRNFRSLRNLEENLEESIAQQESNQEQQQPSAEEIKAQVELKKLELEQQKIQIDAQSKQMDAQLKQAELGLKAADLQLKQNQQSIDAGKAVTEAQQAEVDNAINAAKVSLDRDKLELEARDPSKNVVAGF